MKHRCGSAAIILGWSLAAGAGATDLTVAGLFPGKALVQIDRGPLQTLSVGEKTAQGVVLVSVDADSATFEVAGKRMTLGMGHAHIARSTASESPVMLTADVKGYFIADAQVNGQAVRFVVDTGATTISLPAGEARRLDIDYRKGRRVTMSTANGMAPGYLVRLDSVRVGNLAVSDVEAVVVEGDKLPAALLGMNFLSRMTMKREGDIMTLTKRF